MKKIFKKILVTSLIVTLSAITVYGATFASYPVNINGQTLSAKPMNVDGTTYLPVRAVSEALGVPIEWTGSSVEINTVDLEELKKACVMIVTVKENGMVQGSGVYIDYDQILTAQHVIDGASRYGTLNEEFSAIIDQDENVDVALLNPKSEIKPVKIGDSDEVKVGDKVIVISSPLSEENTVVYTKVYEDTVEDEILISNTGLTSGSSGGAVFNMNGELIGMVYGMADRWCFVRPINDIRKAL